MSVEPLYSKPKCVICAADIKAGARKCTTCDSYQDGIECAVCGLTMPHGAKHCPSCKAPRSGRECRACGETIALETKRCPACGIWQTYRRFVPATEVTLALILSLVSVIGATILPVINYFGNQSKTYIRVIGDYPYQRQNARQAEDSIRVLVTNTGKRQSVIKSASISFDPSVHADPTPLFVMNTDQIVIKPGDQGYLCLSAAKVRRLARKSKEEILDEAKESKRYATITVVVAETDWDDDVKDVLRTDKIETTNIHDWMSTHVSSD